VEKVKVHDFSGARQLLKAVLKRNPAARRAIQDGLIALAKIAGFAKLLGAVTTGAGLVSYVIDNCGRHASLFCAQGCRVRANGGDATHISGAAG
jgi:hypothetical protein